MTLLLPCLATDHLSASFVTVYQRLLLIPLVSRSCLLQALLSFPSSVELTQEKLFLTPSLMAVSQSCHISFTRLLPACPDAKGFYLTSGDTTLQSPAFDTSSTMLRRRLTRAKGRKFLQLPNEIQRMVADHFIGGRLKAFRLVCSALQHLATLMAFSKAYFTPLNSPYFDGGTEGGM